MAEHSRRRDSRHEARERPSVDGAPPSRGRSEQRRSPRSYVRPAVENEDNDDEDELPRPRPPSVHYAEVEPRVGYGDAYTRSYAPIYHPETPGTRPSIAQESSYRRVRYEESKRRGGLRYSPPSPPPRDYMYVSSGGGVYHGPGPNYPLPTSGDPPPERESFGRRRPGALSSDDSQDGTRRRRSRRRHHTMATSEVVDEDGGHYDRPSTLPPGPLRRDGPCREAEPTTANQHITTSSYYDGLGSRAWGRKNRERSGFSAPPELLVDPGELAPQDPSILCFVTVRGEPIFANHATYRTSSSDVEFAAFLKKEYRAIIAKARWLPLRIFHLKTIGAVEFQTWALNGRKWNLAEVDCIPEKVDRASMSHFSYQLRHPFVRVRRWTTKVEKLLQAADQVHSRPPFGEKWNFRIHIIEMLDARAIYFALACVVLPSAAAGLVYGGLTGDFSTGFTIASYVLAAFALLLALVAVTEFLGMESPDSFAANGVYSKGLEVFDASFHPLGTYEGPYVSRSRPMYTHDRGGGLEETTTVRR